MNSLRQSPPNTSATSAGPTDSSESTLATMAGSGGVPSTCSEPITTVAGSREATSISSLLTTQQTTVNVGASRSPSTISC